MKWFKHFSDNYRGRSINHLFNEMGHTGVACYYILMELCAEKLERFPDKNLENSDCLFNFSLRFVRQNLRISLAKVELFLGFCSDLGLLSFEISGENLKIEMPILLDLLEYDQKKSRQRRATIAPEKRHDRAYNRTEYNITDDVVAKTPTPIQKSFVNKNTSNHNSVHKFEALFKPENEEFKKIIDELEIKSMPSLKRMIPQIAESYEYNHESFRSWCVSVINSNSMKNIENVNDRARYFVAAIKREIGVKR